jgi:uridine kinase
MVSPNLRRRLSPGVTPNHDLEAVCHSIVRVSPRPGRRASLIAISGIDASGKGYVSAALARELTARGKRIAMIGIDGWLNLPAVRFSGNQPGLHFYRHALRFDEMFTTLIDPLVVTGSVDCLADYAEETGRSFRKHHYQFQDAEIVLLEGIFLFRRDLRERYDLRIWIECGFESALRRAVAREQEGLPPAETIAAFESIYFPAQRVHFAEDDPRSCAHIIIDNA